MKLYPNLVRLASSPSRNCFTAPKPATTVPTLSSGQPPCCPDAASIHQEKVLCFNMHVTDANMHVPAPSMHVTEIAHVNMMANFSMHVQNSNMALRCWHGITMLAKLQHGISKLQHGISKLQHGVSKLRKWGFKTRTWRFKTRTCMLKM
jgi:hypothetical protein